MWKQKNEEDEEDEEYVKSVERKNMGGNEDDREKMKVSGNQEAKT